MSAKKQQDPLLKTRLGDYAIQELLGRGGMARVYEGLDENLGRRAAVKVLEIDPDDEQDERVIERFKLEARAIASFEHPNIISIYQYGEKDNLFFIAMKLVRGKSLSQVLRENRRTGEILPAGEVLRIVHDVCSALDYAHARGIIHRDIKPSNILFDEEANDRAILTDFGLAMELGGDSTLGTAFGTPRYIAPEQAVSSQKAVPQSDFYSLGVVVYEMLTGQVPFQDESPMSIALYHITSEPPAPRSLNPAIPPEVESVVLKALSKEPEARFPDGEAFYQALEAAYMKAEVDLPTPSVKQPQPSKSSPPEAVPPARQEAKPARRSKNRPQDEPVTPVKPVKAPKPEPEPPRPVETPRKRRSPLLALLLLALLAVVVIVVVLALRGSTAGGGGGAVEIPPDVVLTVNLIYDQGSFALQNPNDYAVPVADLVLAWEGGSRVTGERFHGPIPPHQCAWVRLLSDWQRQPPAECATPQYHLEMLSDSAAIFWAGDGVPDTFRVLKGDQELQTCSVAAGRCSFVLPH